MSSEKALKMQLHLLLLLGATGYVPSATRLHWPTRTARARPAESLASDWVESGGNELGLLPFSLEEALLPGETKQVHLFEARFIQLFSESAAKHHDCLGALYFAPGNNVLSVTSLLEVEEFQKKEFGVWARLKCVGRVRIQELEKTEFDYVQAQVEIYNDDDADDDDRDDKVDAEVMELHSSILSMQERLTDQLTADGSDGSAASEEEQVEWGHEVRDPEGVERGLSLPKLVENRRDVLLSRGPDAAPRASLLEGLERVWAVPSEAVAEQTLLSFAASATLSPLARAQALEMRNGQERLASAMTELRERQKRLSAMLMLRTAGLSTDDKVEE